MRPTFVMLVLLAALAAAGVWFVGAWPRRAAFPAVVKSGVEEAVRTRRAGVIGEIHAERGAAVRAGETLLVLGSPWDEPRLREAEWSLREAETLAEQAWRGDAARRELAWREAEAARRRVEADAVRSRTGDLVAASPVDGVLATWDETLAPGVWLPSGRLLGRVTRGDADAVSCYAEAGAAAKIPPGAEAWFFPDDGGACILGTVERVGESRIEILEDSELAQALGATRGPDGAAVLSRPYVKFMVKLRHGAVRSGQTGRVWLWTAPESRLDSAALWLKSLAIRESSF